MRDRSDFIYPSRGWQVHHILVQSDSEKECLLGTNVFPSLLAADCIFRGRE